jgi:hypothetical protein
MNGKRSRRVGCDLPPGSAPAATDASSSLRPSTLEQAEIDIGQNTLALSLVAEVG